MEVAAAKQLLPMALGPNSPSSSTSSSSPSSAAAAASSPSPRQQHPHAPAPPSPTPRPVPRIIDTTPFPTTFVQADTASFKQVVQRLTGSDTPPPPHKPVKSYPHHHGSGPKKPAFKLYERRIGKSNLKMIAPLAMAAAAAPPEALSPSVLDFPSLALRSPVTPLLPDPFNRSQGAEEDEEAAERAAIARTGFFLHPSPRGAEPPPRLLPLFPVTSPRMAQ
ncbi:VQ motif-containing protein 4 [Zea mays]|uniref:DNA-binding WRKY n=2 Tax=Zea mays TaxID=4577 RepID=K7V1C3_MAIZE|nr:DNA-binding WRKY [Zea mays]AQK94830.1 DNA-binding WRKY [Zea mays]PWZ08766.1 VQ motif-containing protein 4 [Zea mays]|eukprot:NP_001146983.2 DNA-binding WRKY [Zea mays]